MVTIRARKEAILSLMGDKRRGRQAQLARTTGLAESTISRQLNGCEPSAEFMAACMKHWPDQVAELFDVIEDVDETPAAA